MTVAIEQASSKGSEAAENVLPQHVAVIMDGNGRWAKARSKPRTLGHRSGVKAVRALVEAAAERGISYLTLFAFSSENWRRPREEVSTLMNLFLEALQREVDDLHRNNICVRFVGERDGLAAPLRTKIEAAEQQTRDNDGLTLIVAVAYGGRWDIVNATRRLAAKVAAGTLDSDAITEEHFANSLALAGVPDPDLLIRTGGEQRISNFLLWNLAYAELFFCDCYWPDFDAVRFDEALAHFAQRQRRYGCTGEQVAAV
ncbi:isoprenyl transferase [Woeseia oceani]|uniref:isoprenyl transferase n=1 Tax=Woeseia oceani TaxID=1548547 RepID=UPI000A84BBA5|nr:isoprenyl transferase [Woeseia oceani]